MYDMFGIAFAGHPDLRRILMPEEFTAFPLRKDYPLQGPRRAAQFPGDHAGGKLAIPKECRMQTVQCRSS